jgi:hypothetical protein
MKLKSFLSEENINNDSTIIKKIKKIGEGSSSRIEANDKLKYFLVFKNELKSSQGSSRVAFDLKDGTTLKLAYNQRGLSQNGLEIRVWGKSNRNPFLCPVLDFDKKWFNWLIMPTAKPVNELDISNYFGITWVELTALFNDIKTNHGTYKGDVNLHGYVFASDLKKKVPYMRKGLIKMLEDLVKSNPYMDYDFSSGNFGAIDGEIVFIDYGLSDNIIKKYYPKGGIKNLAKTRKKRFVEDDVSRIKKSDSGMLEVGDSVANKKLMSPKWRKLVGIFDSREEAIEFIKGKSGELFEKESKIRTIDIADRGEDQISKYWLVYEGEMEYQYIFNAFNQNIIIRKKKLPVQK